VWGPSAGLWVGIVLVLVAAVGILDLMGAWSYEGERKLADFPGAAKLHAVTEPWYVRWTWVWLLLLGLVIVMPRIGAFGAWDPWEGHYGEVARRILEQDDWISTYWYDNWFFSKPILDMWLMAFGMGLIGVNFMPDGNSALIEWGARGPMGVIAIVAALFVYHAVRRRWGRGAGIGAAIALLTMPFFFFLSHQTMVDMSFVAPMTIAMSLLMVGMYEDPETKVKVFKLQLGRFTIPVSGFHLLVLGFVSVGLTQYLYYATRTMEYHWGTYGQIADDLGGPRVESQIVRFPVWALGPVFGIPWALILYSLRRERRTRTLYLMGFYLFCSLSMLGKGLPGILLPGAVACLHLLITGDWKQLSRVELWRGALVVLVLGFPWYTAMVLRHGAPFLDRLLVHDHINRLAIGVHGDTGNFDYYALQLGIGTFPWTGFIPAALTYKLWNFKKRAAGWMADPAFVFVIAWFMCSYLLFSMMMTKFHHYVFPAVPPLALAVGIFMSDLARGRVRYASAAVAGSFALFAFVARDIAFKPGVGTKGFERLIHLYIYNYSRAWPAGEQWDYTGVLTVFAVAAAVVIGLMLLPRVRKWAVVGLFVVACSFAGWAMNVFMPEISPNWSQGYIIRSYYRDRSGPDERLIVFKLNWKGENYYTGGRAIINETMNDDRFKRWLDEHRGQRHYFLVSMGMKSRLERFLNQHLGPGHVPRVIDDSSNKFTVVVADL
jgi:4-amino-4-deoxy-L-arabinose transferase-like glycosyltransferase